jgi:hypothetical protein
VEGLSAAPASNFLLTGFLAGFLAVTPPDLVLVPPLPLLLPLPRDKITV